MNKEKSDGRKKLKTILQLKNSECESERLAVKEIFKFQDTILQLIEWDKLSGVEFAIWYGCEEDKYIASSPIIDRWIIVYSLCKHHWSYIIANLMKTLKLVDDTSFRMDLPADNSILPFLTTDKQMIILSVSKQKGIRFLFTESTTLERRILFMDNFISYCTAWIKYVEYYGLEKDEDTGFENWWLTTVKNLMTEEKEVAFTDVERIRMK